MDISQHPKPPKKPLTPYMRYSKHIWPTVKAMNTTMSVCEIGATIGRMWRELTDEEKQKFNEQFVQAKADYEVEIQAYLKMTGLTASDLSKSTKKKKNSNQAHQKQQAVVPAPASGMMGAMAGQGIGGMAAPPGYPGAAGTAALMQAGQMSAASALPHFQQIWTTQQYQQAMMLAAQQQQASGTGQDSNTAAAMAMFYAQQQAAAAASATSQEKPQPPQQVSPSIYNDAQNASATAHRTTTSIDTQQQQQGPGGVWNWHQGGQPNTATTQQPFVTQPHQQQQLLQQAHAAQQGQQLGGNAFPEAQRVEPSPDGINGDASSSSPGLSPQSTDQGKSSAPGTPSTASSAHNTYNSYQHFGWGGQANNTNSANGTIDGTENNKVFQKDSMLETELQHLRVALSEKTKVVQKLTQDLENAYHTIEVLKQDRGSPASHQH